MSKVEKITEAEVTEVTEEVVAPQITLQELATLREAMNIAISRGTFKPEELVAVGTVFGSLDTFLKYVEAQSKAASEAEAESDQVTAEPEEA